MFKSHNCILLDVVNADDIIEWASNNQMVNHGVPIKAQDPVDTARELNFNLTCVDIDDTY